MPVRTIVAVLATLLLAVPARADHEPPPPWPEHDRIYLMASGTEYLHWTVDPTDPELDQGLTVRTCGATRTQGVPGHSKPCLTGGLGLDRTHNLYFAPASLLETPFSWSAADPLRFHFELEVEASQPYTVHGVLQLGAGLATSEPATEVAPGVWEGAITSGAPFGNAPVEYVGVRVASQSPSVTMRIKTGGESYLELPQTVGAKAVPDLLREDVYAPEPTSYASSTRTLRFNDDAWQAWTFTGDAGEVATFDLDLPAPAVALVAWAELYDSPFLYDVRRGRPADARRGLDGVAVRLLRDGEEVAHGAGPYIGEGIGSMAATGIGTGALGLEVSGLDQTDDPLPYEAHLVAVYGDRTLASMRWRSPADYDFRIPSIASCPAAIEPFPVTPEVTTFHVDLDWDTAAAGVPSWTLRYDMPGVGAFPCSEGGTGDNVRFTVPGERVWYVGGTPAYDSLHVSAFDTVFDFEVRYAYTPPPKEHEEE